MNYEAAILYAHQRMREIGKTPEQYHFEPVRVSASVNQKSNGYLEIKAYNEIYIIVHPEKYFGLLIVSDNSTFNSDEAIESGAPEFTGLIRIIKNAASWNLDTKAINDFALPIPIEFLRVVIY